MTAAEQYRKSTAEEDIRELYSRLAKLSDRVMSLEDPTWPSPKIGAPDDADLSESQELADAWCRAGVVTVAKQLGVETPDEATVADDQARADPGLRERYADAIRHWTSPADRDVAVDALMAVRDGEVQQLRAELAEARAFLAEVRRFGELCATSCHVVRAETARDLLAVLDRKPGR